jgi:hypothetical protein
MIAVALILLVLVAVLTLGIFVSNPDIYDLSIFGAVVKVSSAGIFLTGAIAMALTIVGVLLLRIGIRRSRARRKEIRALQASSDKAPAGLEADSTTTNVADTSPASDSVATEPATTAEEKSSLKPEGESSTTAAERQAMIDEAEAVTRDEPQK